MDSNILFILILLILFFFSNLDIIIILLFAFIFLSYFNHKPESFSNFVNYPLDAYPDDPEAIKLGAKPDPQFLVKLPYDSLTTRHYKQMYANKMTPKCVLNKTCNTTPGYFKNYFDYFDNPKLLKSYYLGYDIQGIPYENYKFNFANSKYAIDLTDPVQPYDYPTWFDYLNPIKYRYSGYPFYFGDKKMT